MRRGPCPEPNFKDWQGVTGAVFCGKFEGDLGSIARAKILD